MILPVIKYPNPILNMKSSLVTDIDSIKDLAKNLLDTVKSEEALGIASIQCGIPKAIIVVSGDAKNYTVMINPELSGISPYLEDSYELCLSFMKKTKVSRPKSCWVTYTNLEGERIGPNLVDGLLGICVQHEYDHILGQGIWMYDY